MPGHTYFVYMVRCSNGALYTGVTTDVARRLAEHNDARGARYTRVHVPVELMWSEAHPDRSSAMKREAKIKRLPRSKKLELIREGTVSAIEKPRRRKRNNENER
jgi:putative endonuclease